MLQQNQTQDDRMQDDQMQHVSVMYCCMVATG